MSGLKRRPILGGKNPGHGTCPASHRRLGRRRSRSERRRAYPRSGPRRHGSRTESGDIPDCNSGRVSIAALGRMTTLKGRTLFITGASRGIGLAIALRAAQDGANIAIAAKTSAPHPKLEGTIHTAAKAVEAAGGQALPIKADIRDDDQVAQAVAATVSRFGGVDICINNASAISLTETTATEMKRYDLMNAVNGRGTFLVSKLCLPHLLKSASPHILTLAPPINLDPRWFAPHLAYTMAKYAMSLASLGLCGRVPRPGRRQCLVAAHHHRHGSYPQYRRRGRDDAPVAQARDHGRCGAPYPDKTSQLQRKFPHRRGGPALPWHDRFQGLQI